ncbi:MAG: alkylation response protein AidB-like acyl-CoA dehydrogenase [Kiritimatiellia bacterium]|jgi:alkylation response protein AidB-like acyl-CoA dehydrogenase
MTTHNEWLAIVDDVGPGFAEGAAERDANDTFIASHYPIMKEKGLICALVPESEGGGGASYGDMCGILRRLGYHDGPTALALSMHQHLLAAQVFKHRRGMPTPVLGKVGAKKLVLISTGARDWQQSNGLMSKVDGGYRVSARKAFASGGPAGNVLVTSATYEHPTEGWQVLHFPVPMSAEGVHMEHDWKAHGMRSTGSNTIVLDKVFVPEGAVALTRPRADYHPVWNIVLTVALPLICSAYVGIAERAAELAAVHGTRKADLVTTQWSAGEMMSELHVAQACLDQMIVLTNEFDFEPSVALASKMLALKTHTVESAQRVCERAIETAGGAGFYRRTGLERLLRDVRAGQFHPLSRKPQLLFTGRVALGLSPI